MEYKITTDRLQIGLYIHLDIGWMSHPFSFSSFKITDAGQIQTIQDLGLKVVRWDPARSDRKPLPPPVEAEVAIPATAATVSDAVSDPPPNDNIPNEAAIAAMAAKQERVRRLTEYRERIGQVEREFRQASRTVRSLTKTIFSLPGQSVAEATTLINEMVAALLAAPDLAILVMGDQPGKEESYSHSLNVSVLAMMLARELRLPAELVHLVGLGSLFHDVGLSRLPAKILNNPDPLTRAERELMEMHCEYGLEIGRQAGLPAATLQIIFQHHEHYDGSGYPRKLKSEAIDPLARIVSLVNAFDSLCNPTPAVHALTPHEALSQMFAQYRTRFDPRLLQLFIRFMGVYPAGTVVGLSNEMVGMVIAVNADHPLKPTVIVHDPDVPKQEAIVLDLATEPKVNITRAIRPDQLLPAVFDYLSPRRRVSYYFDPGTKAGGVSL